MSYVRRFIDYWSQYYNGFNSTNLSGASDVVVVARKGHTTEDLHKKSAHGGEEEHVDEKSASGGEQQLLRCSQFHVRFGKMGLFRPKKHKVNVYVNGNLVDLKMFVDESGIAYFSNSPSNDIHVEEELRIGWDKMNFDEDVVPEFANLENEALELENENITPSANEEKQMQSPKKAEESSIPLRHNSNPRKTGLPERSLSLNFLDGNMIHKKMTATNDNAKEKLFQNNDLTSHTVESIDPKSKSQMSRVSRVINWVKDKQISSIKGELTQALDDEQIGFELDREDLNLCDMIDSSDLDQNNLAAASKDKRLVLTHKELLSLKLIPGKNDITFSLSTAFQGKKTINASIFLWNDSSKIVISDLDGTVTKSDILGHFFPLIGKEWHHKNVSKLYQKIHNNGYQIIYMSMRNVGYSNLTKRQLSTLVLDGNKLPPGPLVLCPLSLFNTIQIECFLKASDIMKCEIIKRIIALFGPNSSNVYSGFGNTQNDKKVYAYCGIPPSRNFIVNTHGALAPTPGMMENIGTYADLIENVDIIFPKIDSS